MDFQTRCVHTGVDKDSAFNSCTTPIYPSSTFYWDDLNTNSGYDYTRSGNPTRKALEENLASLEGGIDCRAVCTGMAAITASMYLFKPGDHIIAGNDIYGGTFRLFYDIFTSQGYKFSFVNMRDLDAVKNAVTPETKGIWIETPSNPLLNIVNIPEMVEIAKANNLISIADNTFLSPYLQRPMEMGVDVVIHSTTKYLNGHSDVVGGAVITKKEEHQERISYIVNSMGLGCSPFDAWLVLRGVKTLGPRMEAHQRSAIAVARMLDEHPKVEHVYYPGLETHPQHELAKTQQAGFGAMLSFDVAEGREFVEKFFKNLKLFQLAESLGGVESLIEYPETMSHASMTAEARVEAGISEKTIRVSIGIETPEDLVADLKQALDA
ncbi:PLP-dependent aspartate aminotransferase family protein [Planctomicrobium sp.]|jgi:cystathionine gamma-synthase|nr:PLP-dependent aspartate aminotransferase family protein [Planctomicrobium sp.]MDB4439600.1 PLP-dependent aspartate aminotransferase family protein [Planctomicrobium sp.]MDB4732857.1 PLP-dependent aspartate aminotransferase family protein [Planctomicrobium sp.]